MGIMIFAGGVIAKYSWEMVYYIQALAMFISVLMLGKITTQGRKNLSLNKGDEQKHINRWKKLIKYDPQIVFLIFILGFSICDGIFCGYYNMNQLIFSKVGISVAIIGAFFSASYFINSVAYILVNYILKIINRKQMFIYGLILQSIILFALVVVSNKGAFLVISIIAVFRDEIEYSRQKV